MFPLRRSPTCSTDYTSSFPGGWSVCIPASHDNREKSVVTCISRLADLVAVGRHICGGIDEYWAMEGYDGAFVWGEAGAGKRTIRTGWEDIEDDRSGLIEMHGCASQITTGLGK